MASSFSSSPLLLLSSLLLFFFLSLTSFFCKWVAIWFYVGVIYFLLGIVIFPDKHQLLSLDVQMLWQIFFLFRDKHQLLFLAVQLLCFFFFLFRFSFLFFTPFLLFTSLLLSFFLLFFSSLFYKWVPIWFYEVVITTRIFKKLYLTSICLWS